MNPTDFVLAKEENIEELKSKLGLTDSIIKQHLDRIAWRRDMKKALRAEFDEKYPEDALTMFLTSGRQFFDKDVLIRRKMELIHFKPYATLSGGSGVLFHKRIPGRQYIIGADPTTGRLVSETGKDPGSDYCAAVVLDMETSEECGAYRCRVSPQEFAHDLSDLGLYFNGAPIAVERTGDGATVILELTGECRYPAIVKIKEWHRRLKTTTEFEGFPTTTRTRPHACNLVNHFVKNYPELIWDVQFINEAMVFVRNEKGKPEALPGAHDDTVSARWIAHGSRAHLMGYWEPSEGRRASYISADRLEEIGVAV